MVVIPGGIIFPDSCCIFDSCDLRNACHNVNVPKVDYVSQATVEGAFNPRKVKLKINEHTAIVLITIPFKALTFVDILDSFASHVIVSGVI